jgi:hypothetical protein
LPYRTDELSGFAPKIWVPRFSDGVSENSAVGLKLWWPTPNTVIFFPETSRKIELERDQIAWGMAGALIFKK